MKVAFELSLAEQEANCGRIWGEKASQGEERLSGKELDTVKETSMVDVLSKGKRDIKYRDGQGQEPVEEDKSACKVTQRR